MARHVFLASSLLAIVGLAGLLYMQERATGNERALAAPAEVAREASADQTPRPTPVRSDLVGRVMERVQESLALPPDEWSVLEPKIQRVVVAQRELRRASAAWSRWGSDLSGDSGLAVALAEARATLDDPHATPDAVKASLAEVRAERQAVQEQLAAAQAELRSSVTVYEEAALVLAGVLE